jgi:hypothetical protein
MQFAWLIPTWCLKNDLFLKAQCGQQLRLESEQTSIGDLRVSMQPSK